MAVDTEGETTQISLERRRLAIPFGGDGRGRRGEHFAQGGGGGARRSRPELPGDGGGDLGFARELEGRERGECGGWAGSADRPRPEPVRLNRARWAGWVKWAKAQLLKQVSNSNSNVILI
jgi:hypothetical protein